MWRLPPVSETPPPASTTFVESQPTLSCTVLPVPVRLYCVTFAFDEPDFTKMFRYASLWLAAYENWTFDGPRLSYIVLYRMTRFRGMTPEEDNEPTLIARPFVLLKSRFRSMVPPSTPFA